MGQAQDLSGNNRGNLAQIVGKVDAALALRARKSLINHVPEQGFEVVVVPIQVVQNARRTQMPQRHGGHDLGNLLERARAARKCDERIAELDHLVALRSAMSLVTIRSSIPSC